MFCLNRPNLETNQGQNVIVYDHFTQFNYETEATTESRETPRTSGYSYCSEGCVCFCVFVFLFFRGQSRTSCFCVFLKQSITTVSLKGTLSLCEAGGETVKLDRYDESERESWEDQTLWQRAA